MPCQSLLFQSRSETARYHDICQHDWWDASDIPSPAALGCAVPEIMRSSLTKYAAFSETAVPCCFKKHRVLHNGYGGTIDDHSHAPDDWVDDCDNMHPLVILPIVKSGMRPPSSARSLPLCHALAKAIASYDRSSVPRSLSHVLPRFDASSCLRARTPTLTSCATLVRVLQPFLKLHAGCKH